MATTNADSAAMQLGFQAPKVPFSLGVLKESLLKCKSDSSATRGRIKRIGIEIDEVVKRTAEQNAQNEQTKIDVEGMKKRRDELTDDISQTNTYLDHLTKTNCDFIKEKVVNPAKEGIQVAKESIDCFREIIESSYKLNMLFKRAHPEKRNAETQINRPYKTEVSEDDDVKEALEETFKLEKEFFKQQDVLREVRGVARGNKSNKGYFISLSRSEWEEKKNLVDRLIEEENDLKRELAALENSQDLDIEMGEGGDHTGSFSNHEPDWIPPLAPQAVPVSEDLDIPSFGSYIWSTINPRS